jgi:hypothetical protein
VEKLNEIDQQIAHCTITAPKDGTVTYAHDREDWGDGFVVKEGAVVRERQAIIRLPDPTSMRVEVNVNESLIQYVRSGMPATISPVGMGDVVLTGSVQSVNQYAEPSGWRRANVKEYKAKVSIDESADFLRSGMTASVTIRCEYVPNAVQAPVQSVYVHGREYYAFVYDQGKWDARPIKCGPSNDEFFVVESGLKEGDQVAMTPRLFLDEVRLPELPPERARQSTKLFGPRRGAGSAAETKVAASEKKATAEPADVAAETAVASTQDDSPAKPANAVAADDHATGASPSSGGAAGGE